MESEKFKKLVSGILLTIMVGNIDTRMQYLGILINHLNYWIITEKFQKERPTILTVRQHLFDTFGFIVETHKEAQKMTDESNYAIQQEFREKCIVLDATFTTPEQIFIAQTLKELESLRAAKFMYSKAVENYSIYLEGRGEGLTNTTLIIGDILKIVFDICYDNDFVVFSEGDFGKASAAQQLKQTRVPAHNPQQ